MHIEGDFTLIINACIKRQIINKRVRYIMVKIWTLIDSFEIYHISHIYGEGNVAIDLLAKLGFDGINLDSTRLNNYVMTF